MRVRLRVAGDDAESVRSLREWLHHDRAVRAHGALTWARAQSPEHMGVNIEVVSLVLGSGLAAAQLVLAVAQWRDSRHPPPTVTITRELDDGTTIQIESSDPEALEAAVRELEKA